MQNRVARCGLLMWTCILSKHKHFSLLVSLFVFSCLCLSRQCKTTQSCFENKCILFFNIALKMNNHYCSTSLDYELREL